MSSNSVPSVDSQRGFFLDALQDRALQFPARRRPGRMPWRSVRRARPLSTSARRCARPATACADRCRRSTRAAWLRNDYRFFWLASMSASVSCTVLPMVAHQLAEAALKRSSVRSSSGRRPRDGLGLQGDDGQVAELVSDAFSCFSRSVIAACRAASRPSAPGVQARSRRQRRSASRRC